MSPKLDLHRAIETLSEPECSKLLLLISTWHDSVTPSMAYLSENPTFRIPSKTVSVFLKVSPIIGHGPNASNQLVEERR